MKKALLNIVTSPIESHIKKVSVIGVGSVGMAISMALVTQKICTVLALVDKDDKRVKGEAMDLEEGTIYTGCRILSSNDYSITENSRLIVIAAGTVRNGDEEKVAWAQRNVDILKDIIPEIMKYNPEPVLLIVSGPVDILTYAAWKLSGLPQNRVLGSGTVLDSARFRNLIAERLGVNSRSVHGFIVGEHEENSVPIWSSVSVGGVRLVDIDSTLGIQDDPEDWKGLHAKVIESDKTIVTLKRKTCWAVSLCVAKIAASIIQNSWDVLSVSTVIKGCKHDEDKEVCMSIPCVIGRNGVINIIKETLTDTEREQVFATANQLFEIISQLKL